MTNNKINKVANRAAACPAPGEANSRKGASRVVVCMAQAAASRKVVSRVAACMAPLEVSRKAVNRVANKVNNKTKAVA